jgi:hypothetical protein
MGITRARRSANNKCGRKCSPDRTEVLAPDVDPVNAESVRIFDERYPRVKNDADDVRRTAERLARAVGSPHEATR